MTHRHASIFRDGFSQLQMEERQTAASSNHSHFYSLAPDMGPLKALAGSAHARAITMQHYNYGFHSAGALSHRLFWTMCRGFALFFLSLPTQKQAGSLFQTSSSPCSASSSTDCLISSESATSDQPQLAWTWAKDFSLQFCCTMWSK